jgi:hypothetical protein
MVQHKRDPLKLIKVGCGGVAFHVWVGTGSMCDALEDRVLPCIGDRASQMLLAITSQVCMVCACIALCALLKIHTILATLQWSSKSAYSCLLHSS